MSILHPRTSPTPTPSDIQTSPSEVRVVWRALACGDEGQPMEPLEVRATLHPDRIRLERIEHEEVVAAVVAPCTSQSIEVTRGSSPLNVHCWTTIDGNPDGPSLRLAMDQDGLVVLRTSLLGRLGVQGGTHDLVSVTIDD